DQLRRSFPILGFAAGTLILTADGYKAIEDIKPGDLIKEWKMEGKMVTLYVENGGKWGGKWWKMVENGEENGDTLRSFRHCRLLGRYSRPGRGDRLPSAAKTLSRATGVHPTGPGQSLEQRWSAPPAGSGRSRGRTELSPGRPSRG